MLKSLIVKIALLVAVGDLFAPLAHAEIYRCRQPDGSVTLSDKACPGGDVREGNEWTSLQEIERRRAEAVEDARKLEVEKREIQAASAKVRERAASERTARQYSIRSSREPVAKVPISDSIDRMTTYAVVLGRAIGCGMDVSGPSGRVGDWFDSNFPLGPQKVQYLSIMAQGIKHHAEQQRRGNSPDSCSQVRVQMANFPWP